MDFFGPRWDAPVIDSGSQVETPVGMSCLYCQELIACGDQGFRLPYLGIDEDGGPLAGLGAIHRECMLRSSVGSVEHLEGQCFCYGGSTAHSTKSYREQGREVQAWLETHCL